MRPSWIGEDAPFSIQGRRTFKKQRGCLTDALQKYLPIVKVDEQAHVVWGLVTSETPDRDGEICDFEAAKAAFQKWADESFSKTTAAGQEPSLGNIRVMHQLQVGGKAIHIEFKDADKQIWLGTTPANDAVWGLLKGGFLTSYSQGGSWPFCVC